MSIRIDVIEKATLFVLTQRAKLFAVNSFSYSQFFFLHMFSYYFIIFYDNRRQKSTFILMRNAAAANYKYKIGFCVRERQFLQIKQNSYVFFFKRKKN